MRTRTVPRDKMLCYLMVSQLFLFHLFWSEAQCLNPSNVSVSWALVLREILREEWESSIEDDGGRREHDSVDMK